jgi:hypothetical protein
MLAMLLRPLSRTSPMLQPKNPVLQPQNRPLHHGRGELHPSVSLLQPNRQDKRPRSLASSCLKLKKSDKKRRPGRRAITRANRRARRVTRTASVPAGPKLRRRLNGVVTARLWRWSSSEGEAFPLVLPRLAGRQGVWMQTTLDPAPPSAAGRCGPRQGTASTTRTLGHSFDPSLPPRRAEGGWPPCRPTHSAAASAEQAEG